MSSFFLSQGKLGLTFECIDIYFRYFILGFLKSRKKKERSKKGKGGKEEGGEIENKVKKIGNLFLSCRCFVFL